MTDLPGSSTCCLAVLNAKTGKLHSVNLGDSGLIIYRPSIEEIVFDCERLEHSHNYPFQLGLESLDKPRDAVRESIDVKVDDIIIAGTDGLWDNLFIKHIIRLIQSKNRSPQELARVLALQAWVESHKPVGISPFALRARASSPAAAQFQGGKPDDITVVVAKVVNP